MKISKREIINIAHDVLFLNNYNTKNKCDSINNEILHRIQKRFDRNIPPAEKCTVNGHNHFVGFIPHEIYANSEKTSGNVLIDAALRQFEDEFDEQIPEIVILEENFSKYYQIDKEI